MKEELIEQLADIQHQIWSSWMEYLFSKCPNEVKFENAKHFETANLIIPKDLVERWKRQIETPYSELTEAEKQSDRDQVLKFIHLLNI